MSASPTHPVTTNPAAELTSADLPPAARRPVPAAAPASSVGPFTLATPTGDEAALAAALAGVSSAFASLGRVFFCVDASFHVLHASSQLDRLVGPGAAERAQHRPLADLLGAELFGPAGTLRQFLLAGERREGWRSTLEVPGSTPRPVSVTAAPFCAEPGAVCDPRVAFVVVLRPAEEDIAPPDSPYPGLIGRSAAMTRVFRLIENLEHSEATVLLSGESGTGKEVVARAIHARSQRRAGPFVAVNCGALPGELLESELFGHVRGAFTGAVRDRAGRFEVAAGGTLFLDEVGDLPLHLQVKLLRVLQERSFERVGESRTRTSDARIIAATNVDLRRAVAEGRFREDLYYRLRVVPLEIPPLRARREDIEPLASFLLARVAARQGRALRFSPDALRALLRHGWPGNVRELENALEYAVAVCKGQTILPEDLPVEVGDEPAGRAVTAAWATPREVAAARDEARRSEADALDRARIKGTLEACQWRRHEAARVLGISRTTLWRRMRELGLA
jgi:DNA-binding NtrC family response regulator